jgi:cystathionine beta-lyase/cystathionine gamma-synthase
VLWQGGDRAFAFASGMAALGAVVRLAAAGQHIIAGDDLYGGTSRLLQRIAPGLGLEVSNVDMSDPRCAPLKRNDTPYDVPRTRSCAAAGSCCDSRSGQSHCVGRHNTLCFTVTLVQQLALAVAAEACSRPHDDLCNDCRNVAAAVQPGRTALVMVESPTNPRMQVCDIAALAAIAHDAGAICCVDNRWGCCAHVM